MIIREWAEITEVLPPLGTPEREALRVSIAADGVKQPILVLPDGRIIDGHHRWDLSGGNAPYSVVDLPENQAFDLAIDLNLARRQLSRQQLKKIREVQKRRRDVAKEMARQMRLETPEDERPSQQEVADAVGYSQPTIDRWENDIPIIHEGTVNNRNNPDNRVSIPKSEHARIFDRAASGATQEQIAADYQVCQSAISKIIKREQKRRQEEEALRAAAGAVSLPDTVQLFHSRFEDIVPTISSGSVDVIITDPPYPGKYVPLYGMLAEQAARLLCDGGSLLAMAGHSYLPAILNLMTPHLNYHWVIAYTMLGGQSAQHFPRKINTFWKPVLWFVKGNYEGPWVGDVVKSEARDKRFDDWGQSESGMAGIVERFSKPGDLILDPFCGTGTTGVVALAMERRFIGIDMDAEKIEKARERICYVQPG